MQIIPNLHHHQMSAHHDKIQPKEELDQYNIYSPERHPDANPTKLPFEEGPHNTDKKEIDNLIEGNDTQLPDSQEEDVDESKNTDNLMSSDDNQMAVEYGFKDNANMMKQYKLRKQKMKKLLGQDLTFEEFLKLRQEQMSKESIMDFK